MWNVYYLGRYRAYFAPLFTLTDAAVAAMYARYPLYSVLTAVGGSFDASALAVLV